MDQRVHNVFAGHLRSIVGSMTVENMIQDRELLTSKTRESSGDEMGKLGLIIDSLQIQEIDDPTGYIENLAKPHNAVIASNARIAAAEADRLATEAEQTADALMGQSRRDTAIKMAGFQAEQDAATSQAKQAGPLAEATARQAVVDQETEAARREAARQEQILLATVVRPAEAQRDADVASAQAESRVAVLKAEGEARRVELEAGAAAKATGRRSRRCRHQGPRSGRGPSHRCSGQGAGHQPRSRRHAGTGRTMARGGQGRGQRLRSHRQLHGPQRR
jgi:flotillin